MMYLPYNQHIMYLLRMDASLNRGVASYDDAGASLELEGGYFFTYQDYYFVTETDADWEFDLNSADSDWVRIAMTAVSRRIKKHGCDCGHSENS